MSLRELYEYALIETNKLGAPSLLLEDYNYFINKAVQQYVNLIYSRFETDQQSTDDLRVLKTSIALKPQKINEKYKGVWSCSYIVILPDDYHHLLGCTIEYDVQKSFKCYDKDGLVMFPVRRLSTDMYSQIANNAYMSPSYKRPYYFISNVGLDEYITSTGEKNPIRTGEAYLVAKIIANKVIELSSKTNEDVEGVVELYVSSSAKSAVVTSIMNKISDSSDAGYELTADHIIGAILNVEEFGEIYGGNPRELYDSIEEQESRLSNPSAVVLELRFGKDDRVFKPENVYVDYLKSPKYLRLTQEQIEATEDESQILEFPDYVCFEIANIFTRLLLENASDPRLQTNIPINNTITSAAQQQAAAQK